MILSIIIPTYNEEEYLPVLLDSIKKQNFSDYEIIIADANSTDNTREIAKSYGCMITEGGLPAIGRNCGADVANGELLLFLDSDLILTESYLKEVIDEFEEYDLGLAITQMIPLSSKLIHKILHEVSNKFLVAVESIKPSGAGCCGIISKKELHQEVDGFDESLDYGEDTDYLERVGKLCKFRVLRKPRILVSVRRIEKEGLLTICYKYTKSTIYDFLGRRLTAKDLNYDFEYDDKGESE